MTTLEEMPAAPAAAITYREEYRCPRCESAIPPTAIKREPPSEREAVNGVHRVSIYCAHCNDGFEINSTLRDGLLRPGAVFVMGIKELQAMKDHVGKIAGDRQRRGNVLDHAFGTIAIRDALKQERVELQHSLATATALVSSLRQADQRLAERIAGIAPDEYVAPDNGKDFTCPSLGGVPLPRKIDRSTSQLDLRED